MCGGGGSKPKDRTDEMLAVQREQISEQKKQYEETRADNLARQEEQKKIATAPSAPPPNATAQAPAAALELPPPSATAQAPDAPTPSGASGSRVAQKRRGYGRRRLRTDLKRGSGLQIP